MKYEDLSKFDRFRDVVACNIANFVLNHIATPRYRKNLRGVIVLGLEELKNASHEEE